MLQHPRPPWRERWHVQEMRRCGEGKTAHWAGAADTDLEGASLHAMELLHHVVHPARLGLHIHGSGVRLVLSVGVGRPSLDDLVKDRIRRAFIVDRIYAVIRPQQ